MRTLLFQQHFHQTKRNNRRLRTRHAFPRTEGTVRSGLNTKSQFYLNTDNNASSGYNPANWATSGVDTLLENQNLFAYSGTGNGWTWSLASTLSAAQYVRNDTVIEIAVPLTSLGLTPGSTIRLGFITNDSTVNRLPAANGTLLSYTLS